MPQRPQRTIQRTIQHHRFTAQRIATSVRRPEESLRNAGSRASHSQPAVLGEAVSPLFPRRRHSAILNAAAASEKGRIWAERRARRAKLWDVWTLAAVCSPTPASSHQPAQIRSRLALVAWSWSLSLSLSLSCLSSLASGCFNVDVSLGVSLGISLGVFPWRFPWRST
jgi:hypothetical protein